MILLYSYSAKKYGQNNIIMAHQLSRLFQIQIAIGYACNVRAIVEILCVLWKFARLDKHCRLGSTKLFLLSQKQTEHFWLRS